MAELEWDDTFLKAKMNRAIERGLTVCALVVETDAVTGAPEHDGQLINSIGTEVDMSEVDMKKASVKATAGHAASVEHGREPGHMPPVEPLKKWSKDKLGDENAAWAVAMKIKKEGIAEKPFMRPALDNNSSRFEGIMAEEMAREFR